MGIAFEMTRAAIRLDGQNAIDEIIARKIIEPAHAGERNPDQLCQRVPDDLRSRCRARSGRSRMNPTSAGERNPPNLLRACVPHQNALDASSRRGGFADCGIHARHNLLRHQLHGAFVERGIDPVHAGIDQLPEIAGFLA